MDKDGGHPFTKKGSTAPILKALEYEHTWHLCWQTSFLAMVPLMTSVKVDSRSRSLIPSRDIPQADLLQDVVACTRIVSRGAVSYQQIATLLRKTHRQGRYYRRAAEILGLIEKCGKNKSLSPTIIMFPNEL